MTDKLGLFHRAGRKLHWWSYRLFWGGMYGNLVHPWKERIHRRPDAAFERALGAAPAPAVAEALQALRQDGIAALPGYVQGHQLEAAQREFDAMCRTIESAPPAPRHAIQPPVFGQYAEYEAHSPDLNTTYTYHPFQFSAALLGLALDGFVREVVARYFGKEFMLSEPIASRYYPMVPKDFASWMWHHDGLGKRVNVMFLLSDVTAQDQFMSYLKGSHRLIHRYPHRGGTSRVTAEQVKGYSAFPRLDCLAKAGTVFLFDSNGIHRGNRSLGAVRDTLIACYCCGRHVVKLPVRSAYFASLADKQKQFLRRNPRFELVD